MLREADPSAMAHDPGLPFEPVFLSKLNSEEFLNRVVPHVLALRPPVPYVPSWPFEEIRAWAASRLPVSKELRMGIMNAGSCEEILRLLLQDQFFIGVLPRLREAGVDRLLRIQLAETDRFQRATVILGEIIFTLEFEIRGWCANRADLAERMIVEIFADNIFLGSIVCDQYLPSLKQRLGGDGCHGFRFVVPGAFRARFRHDHTVSVLERSTGVIIGSVCLESDRALAHSAVNEIKLEIRKLREKLIEIETRLPELEQGLGYPIDLYNEYGNDYGSLSPVTESEIKERSAALSCKPSIALIVEAGAVPINQLMATIESIRGQSYDGWELMLVQPRGNRDNEIAAHLNRWQKTDPRIRIVASEDEAGIMNARLQAVRESAGDWFGFVGAGDQLTPDAAFWLAMAAQERGVGLIYTDEDMYDLTACGDSGWTAPQLKGSFDEDLLLAHDYIGNLCIYRKTVFDQSKPLNPIYEEVLDYHLKLRIIARLEEKQIRHVCRVLYHRRAGAPVPADDPAHGKRQSLLSSCAEDYLRQTGRSAMVEPHADALGRNRPLANRIRWSAPATWPALSILVPTRDRMDLLDPCLTSAMTAIAGYRGPAEIVIIDNDSAEEETKQALKGWAQRPQVTVIPYHGEFNWSAINNRGVECASGDILLFLNNDTLVLSDDWCVELVTQACRPEVGAVGARLFYQDGRLQHGGIILGERNVLHEGAGETPEEGGYRGRTHLQRGASAVTGACLATRRDVFERVSGFDPYMRVEFSDIDYCLTVRSIGLRVIYTPFATMYHFESKSRGLEAAATRRYREPQERAIFIKRWQRLMGRDPFCNRHFDTRTRPFFRLNRPPSDPLETVDWSPSESQRKRPSD